VGRRTKREVYRIIGQKKEKRGKGNVEGPGTGSSTYLLLESPKKKEAQEGIVLSAIKG